MTNAQSRFLTTVSGTRKEFTHPWTDSCANASDGLLLSAIPYTLRVYTMVYVLSLIMRHRIPSRAHLKRTALGILQSSAFLVTNAYTFILINCLMRKIIGHYYHATTAFVPGFLCSLLINWLYVANLATEVLWKMGIARGYVRSIPQGQTLIFGISISALLYLYRLGLHKGTCKDSLFNVLRFFVDKAEEGPIVMNLTTKPGSTNIVRSHPPIDFRSINVIVQLYSRFLEAVKSKPPSCPHRDNCWRYAFVGGIKLFVGGSGPQMGLRIVLNLRRILQFKLDVRKTFFDKDTLKLGIFLGCFSSVYKGVSYTLRHSFVRDDPRFAIPAGLLGSIAFSIYLDVTVAIYVMWKALQILYNLGIDRVLPHVNNFTIYL
ncbi:transmembrane protein 135-like [Eurosta solidaginis]|uniref:transmembrane protein 135-like n=1 Tax=Eurosta solidaginis TaxID=178769 RepID=UPI003530D04E